MLQTCSFRSLRSTVFYCIIINISIFNLKLYLSLVVPERLSVIQQLFLVCRVLLKLIISKKCLSQYH